MACKSLYPESWRQGVEGGLGARDWSTTERRESLSALKQIPRWGCAIVRAGDVKMKHEQVFTLTAEDLVNAAIEWLKAEMDGDPRQARWTFRVNDSGIDPAHLKLVLRDQVAEDDG